MMDSERRKESFLIVDVSDTLTKAILIERKNGRYVVKEMVEAVTTVEPPGLDVTIGVKNAIEKLEEASGIRLLHGSRMVTGRGKLIEGVDLFLCSSNSGGGLHMIASGVTSLISVESAQRAALGAGAFLMDLFSTTDNREDYERVERMRSLRPDMFLLAGGIDGGAVKQVIEMAELIKKSDVRPRFGSDFKLPVIYAGNIEIRKDITEVLAGNQFALKLVENVRPAIEKENLGPAREGIYDAFMEHVIVHSPGYKKLMEWIDESIIPTQATIGRIIYAYAQDRGVNLMGVDVGGTTTDVYSVFDGVFNRSLNADFGMNYAICNIMKEAGIENILRWIPIEIGENEVRNIIGNMMIHLSDPRSLRELLVQHSVAREAIRLGIEHHKTIATRLKGVLLYRSVLGIFNQAMDDTYIKMMGVNIIVGKGRVLSCAPRMEQAALILLDSLQPEGITEVVMDKLGIMPHLGSLLKVNHEAAIDILKSDCLSKLGTCIAPKGVTKEGKEVLKVYMRRSDGKEVNERVTFGELKTLPLEVDERVYVEILPSRGFDVGNGRGKSLKTRVTGGEIGLIIDARGRPITLPETKQRLVEWIKEFNAYPNIFSGKGSGEV